MLATVKFNSTMSITDESRNDAEKGIIYFIRYSAPLSQECLVPE